MNYSESKDNCSDRQRGVKFTHKSSNEWKPDNSQEEKSIEPIHHNQKQPYKCVQFALQNENVEAIEYSIKNGPQDADSDNGLEPQLDQTQEPEARSLDSQNKFEKSSGKGDAGSVQEEKEDSR